MRDEERGETDQEKVEEEEAATESTEDLMDDEDSESR